MRVNKPGGSSRQEPQAVDEPPTMKTVSEMNLLQSLAPVWGYNNAVPFEFD